MTPPPPPPAAWDERQITRAKYRLELFIRRGMDEDVAGALVDRLALRDVDRDTRVTCIECAHWPAGGQRPCTSPRPGALPYPLRSQLHQCPAFDWQTPA